MTLISLIMIIFDRIDDMSYLTIREFDSDIDIFLEHCFDLAIEENNEQLLEFVLLSELSNDLKLRAAKRALNNSEYSNDQIGLQNISRWMKDAGTDYVKKAKLADQLQDELNNIKQNIFKRDRIYKNYTNTPSGTEYDNRHITRSGKKIPHIGEVNSEDKIGMYMFLSGKNIYKKEFDEIQKEINDVKAEIEKNASHGQKLNIKVRKKLNNFLNALTKKYNKFRKQYQNTPPEKRSILEKILYKITEIIEWISNIIYMR